MSDALLRVRDLRMTIEKSDSGDRRRVLLGVDFEIAHGEALGLIGESGSGKSMTARSILRIVPEGAHLDGDIQFRGTSVLGMGKRQLRSYRSSEVSMVFQDPRAHLDPTHTIGDFLVETLRGCRPISRRNAYSRAVTLLDEVRIANAARRMAQYPHELSGGMLQRVMIASALAPEPALLVADEPTTALDVTVQAEIVRILTDLRRQRQLAMLFITHDVELAEVACDHVAVMYAGRIVEKQEASLLSRSAAHPYTIGLMNSRPKLGLRAGRLHQLPGRPLSPHETPPGCAFADRCGLVIGECRKDPPPPLRQLPTTIVACHRAEIASALFAPVPGAAETSHPPRPGAKPPNAVIVLSGVSRVFQARGRFRRTPIVAVDDVSFIVEQGDSLAIVGESGSGKTTIARMLVGLDRPTAGIIAIDGQQRHGRRLGTLDRAESARKIQIVFQDPYASLDPRQTVGSAVKEALRRSGSKADLPRRIHELMDRVGLSGNLADRYPRKLSGGQRQRVAIARALALDPEVLVLDEAVASLDVSIQAQILNVLAELRRELSVTYVFITHDLSVVQQVADTALVMHHGKVVEQGRVDDILRSPQTDYTRTLLASVPSRLPALSRVDTANAAPTVASGEAAAPG